MHPQPFRWIILVPAVLLLIAVRATFPENKTPPTPTQSIAPNSKVLDVLKAKQYRQARRIEDAQSLLQHALRKLNKVTDAERYVAW